MTTDVMQDNLMKFVASIGCAFTECDDDTRRDIFELSEIIKDGTSTEDEKKQASLTMYYLLFPNGSFGLNDPRLESDLKNVQEVRAQMKDEEKSFSEKLGALMKTKKITQADLAAQIGVGQSAIANMLARECRPQQRTIQKLADALGVKPSDLWTNL
jgi:lambda repressor-like predicted transcriptional regulator